MPHITVSEISWGDVLGGLGAGNRMEKGFGGFVAHPCPIRSAAKDYSSQDAMASIDALAAYRLRRAEARSRTIMGAAVVLLVVVVVLAFVLIRKTVGRKARPGMAATTGLGGTMSTTGQVSALQFSSDSYDLKDREIDRKDKEIERKEMEIERKEKDLEKEREKRQKIASRLEAERSNFNRELAGTQEELRKLREEREKLRLEMEAQKARYEAEMRRAREEFDSKASAVRKRFEERLSEFETTQKQFWPEVFREARSLGAFCECVKESFAEGSNTAATLYSELVNLGSRLGDMQAFVNKIAPVGKALYAWIYDTGRTGDGFDLLLARWLTEKVSSVDLKVVAVQPGEAYNNSIHDCANVGGNSVSKVLSFLILGKSNRTELKAIVEVG